MTRPVQEEELAAVADELTERGMEVYWDHSESRNEPPSRNRCAVRASPLSGCNVASCDRLII